MARKGEVEVGDVELMDPSFSKKEILRFLNYLIPSLKHLLEKKDCTVDDIQYARRHLMLIKHLLDYDIATLPDNKWKKKITERLQTLCDSSLGKIDGKEEKLSRTSSTAQTPVRVSSPIVDTARRGSSPLIIPEASAPDSLGLNEIIGEMPDSQLTYSDFFQGNIQTLINFARSSHLRKFLPSKVDNLELLLIEAFSHLGGEARQSFKNDIKESIRTLKDFLRTSQQLNPQSKKLLSKAIAILEKSQDTV